MGVFEIARAMIADVRQAVIRPAVSVTLDAETPVSPQTAPAGQAG
jgi:hypothetical protein